MAKSLNLKISKAKLIKSLEKALTERQARFENNDKAQAKYDKEMEAYRNAVIKLVKSGKGEVTEATEHRHYGRSKRDKTSEFCVTVKLPTALCPKEPDTVEHYPDYRWRSDKEALENALRMLALCDDEYVSAGTLKSVSEYL